MAYTYVDGGGATLLTKAQAEPGVAPLQDATTGALIRDGSGNIQFTSSSDERWVGSGRVVRNNKGDPVKQYEPYFSSVAAFDDESELVFESPAVVLHYDPLGRPVRTQHPDGTEEHVERFTWSELSHDRSDTVAGSRWDTDAAASSDPHVLRARTLSLAHDSTPTTQHLDAMGRVFQVDEDNGTAGAPVLHTTTTELDIKGRTLGVTDARGNTAGAQQFDLLDRVLRLTTADGGTRWTLPAVDGQPVRGWDERDHVERITYDELRRPVSRYVATGGGSEVVRSHMVYGEALGTAAAQTANLLGQVHEVYDGAGVRTVVQQDFDGNVTETTRRLRLTPAGTDPTSAWTAYALGPDWSALPVAANLAALQTAAAADLETETFTHEMTTDALGRPLTSTTPDASVTRYGYNEAGLLDALDVQLRGAASWTPFVSDIDYDPLGRRISMVLGNGVETTYAYDPDSRRLTNLRSQRSGGGTILQDLGYTYDAAGSIVAITDGAQQTTFFDNAVVSPDRRFEYDPRHRLVRAEGRCHPGQQPTSSLPPERSIPHPNDSTTLQAYIQTYVYDAVGNIMEMAQSRGGSVAWRRRYQYALSSNRLSSTSASMAEPSQPGYVDPSTGPRYLDTYEHDAHGSMTSMPGLSSMGWDADDQLVEVDLGGGGTAYYVYDAAGQRVRKTIRRQSGADIVERVYLDGWEIYRRRMNGTLDEEIETLHVIDDETRICLVETESVTAGATISAPPARSLFQLQDHLGTCSVEVDETTSASVISYEECFPYGATAYRASNGPSAKRYRYVTKERDDETGLHYFGARLLAPWLGRWTQADPLGSVGYDRGFLSDATGLRDEIVNLYSSTRSDPIGLVDRTGLSGDEVDAYGDSCRISRESEISWRVARNFVIEAGASVLTGGLAIALDDPAITYSLLELNDAVREQTRRDRVVANSLEGFDQLSVALGVIGFEEYVFGSLGRLGRYVRGAGARASTVGMQRFMGFAVENAGGAQRSADEVADLIRQYLPENLHRTDVKFRFGDTGDAYATYGPQHLSPSRKYVSIDDLVDEEGDIVITINKNLADSDQQIVAAVAHELVEIARIEEVFEEFGGVRMPSSRYALEVNDTPFTDWWAPGRPSVEPGGNTAHHKANEIVLGMLRALGWIGPR